MQWRKGMVLSLFIHLFIGRMRCGKIGQEGVNFFWVFRTVR